MADEKTEDLGALVGISEKGVRIKSWNPTSNTVTDTQWTRDEFLTMLASIFHDAETNVIEIDCQTAADKIRELLGQEFIKKYNVHFRIAPRLGVTKANWVN